MQKDLISAMPLWLRLAILAGLILAVVIAAQIARSSVDMDWSVTTVRERVEEFGLWGPFAFILLVAFRFIFLLPISIVLVASGLVFGAVFCTLWAGLGLILSALMKYVVLKLIGRESIVRMLPEKHRGRIIDRIMAIMNPWVLTGTCAYPFFPKHIFQVAALLAGMHFLIFLICVSVGAFIRAAFFAGFGEAMFTGSYVYPYAAALLAVFAIPLCVPSLRRVFVKQSTL